MMKFLFVFFLIPAFAFGQNDSLTLPRENGAITFTRIISLDSLTKDQIYDRVKNFSLSIFTDKASQLADDKTTGYLAYRSYFKEILSTITLKCFIKEGKLKLQLTDLYFDMYNESWEKFEESTVYSTKHLKYREKAMGLIKSVPGFFNSFLDMYEQNIKKKSAFDF